MKLFVYVIIQFIQQFKIRINFDVIIVKNKLVLGFRSRVVLREASIAQKPWVPNFSLGLRLQEIIPIIIY